MGDLLWHAAAPLVLATLGEGAVAPFRVPGPTSNQWYLSSLELSEAILENLGERDKTSGIYRQSL